MLKASQYRADIDGLRAIAVLSVLFNHLNKNFFHGGFLGVDIFFVISGFLITAHIYEEAQNRTFSFKNFYKRRINRIIPALVVVISVTTVAAFFLLSSTDLIVYSKSAFFSLFGVSNAFFWREYGDYFEGNTQEAMLLHTWSLGVEEQFYFLWPIIILALLKYVPRHIKLMLMIFFLISLGVSEYGANNFASASYFLLPTRFFELAIGGITAVITSTYQPKVSLITDLAGITGLLLIAISALTINETSTFPGMNALYPCLGTVLLIYSGMANRSISKTLLSIKPLVFIGLISYSLYLWHWPIITFVNYLDIEIDILIASGIILLSIALAYVTWRYVEKPFRETGKTLSFLPVFTKRLLIPCCIFAIVCGMTVKLQGFPDRYPHSVAKFEAMVATKPDELRPDCLVSGMFSEAPPNTHKCTLGVTKKTADGIMIGDSYANHFSGMVDVMSKAEDLKIIDYAMHGCQPIMGFVSNKKKSYADRCAKRNELAYQHIAQSKYKYVILAANWPFEEDAGKLIKQSITSLLNNGKKVTVILSNPSIKDASFCSIRKIMYHSERNCSDKHIPQPVYWSSIQKEFPSVVFIDPTKLICTHGTCSPVLNDILLYRDNGHLNDVGSRLLGKTLVTQGISLTTKT